MLPGTARYDRAIRLALDHAQWCWAAGMSPAQVLLSIGATPAAAMAEWDEAALARVVWALAQQADAMCGPGTTSGATPGATPGALQLQGDAAIITIVADDQLDLPLGQAGRRAAA